MRKNIKHKKEYNKYSKQAKAWISNAMHVIQDCSEVSSGITLQVLQARLEQIKVSA